MFLFFSLPSFRDTWWQEANIVATDFFLRLIYLCLLFWLMIFSLVMVDDIFYDKGSCHLRFSGIRPLRGGGVPPFSAKEKNLLFFTLIFR